MFCCTLGHSEVLVVRLKRQSVGDDFIICAKKRDVKKAVEGKQMASVTW